MQPVLNLCNRNRKVWRSCLEGIGGRNEDSGQRIDKIQVLDAKLAGRIQFVFFLQVYFNMSFV